MTESDQTPRKDRHDRTKGGRLVQPKPLSAERDGSASGKNGHMTLADPPVLPPPPAALYVYATNASTLCMPLSMPTEIVADSSSA
jgi:hypothetical protein